jgi:hypothetical protein
MTASSGKPILDVVTPGPKALSIPIASIRFRAGVPANKIVFDKVFLIWSTRSISFDCFAQQPEDIGRSQFWTSDLMLWSSEEVLRVPLLPI